MSDKDTRALINQVAGKKISKVDSEGLALINLLRTEWLRKCAGPF